MLCHDLLKLYFHAALPLMTSFSPTDSIYVFRGDSVQLTCPFEYGNLFQYFDPYELTWTLQDGGVSTTLLDSSENLQLSSDRRELLVAAEFHSNFSGMFQCGIRLSRCTYFDDSKEVSKRCDEKPPFFGPLTTIRLLGKMYAQIQQPHLTYCNLAMLDINPLALELVPEFDQVHARTIEKFV